MTCHSRLFPPRWPQLPSFQVLKWLQQEVLLAIQSTQLPVHPRDPQLVGLLAFFTSRDTRQQSTAATHLLSLDLNVFFFRLSCEALLRKGQVGTVPLSVV